jgi:hypothetical protein
MQGVVLTFDECFGMGVGGCVRRGRKWYIRWMGREVGIVESDQTSTFIVQYQTHHLSISPTTTILLYQSQTPNHYFQDAYFPHLDSPRQRLPLNRHRSPPQPRPHDQNPLSGPDFLQLRVRR